MNLPCRWFLLVVLLVARSASAEPAADALARGQLSLAWDAHESGLFEESLGYLKNISPETGVAGEAAWLHAECLYDLGRYAEAVAALETTPGRAAEGRDDLLLDIYWDWTWDRTREGAYDEAQRIAERGLRQLPGEGSLAGLAKASRFRGRVARALAGGGGTLASGESVLLRPVGGPPRGDGWIQAFPWGPELPWVPRNTADEWMKGLAERLSREGRVLWVRVPRSRLLQTLREAAGREGLSVAVDDQARAWVGDRDGRVAVSLEEWCYRAAAEGLGAEGGAVSALAEARRVLGARAEVAEWLSDHRNGLEIRWLDNLWRLRDPGTGRSFDLDPVQWAELIRTDPEQWQGFWADLRAELGRPSRPFLCFCGRPVVLREVLQRDAAGALVFERGRGYVVVMESLCPLHRQYVTAETASSWGVGLPELLARARQDEVRQPWELRFSRNALAGTSFLFLEGEGAAALARDPELLLGAIEGVDGVGARGRSVRVLAPTPTSLLVADADASEMAAEKAAARSLLQAARDGVATERLDFHALVHLPERGRGNFQLTAAE